MITITTQLEIPEILLHMDKMVDKSLPEVAKRVADDVAFNAVGILESRAKQSTGKLAGAIKVKKAEARARFARYDVVVDMKQVPYAEWVEDGANAPFGLPYSKSGKKDYSKSKFKGHHYLRDGVNMTLADTEKFTQMVAYPIIKRIITMKGSKIIR